MNTTYRIDTNALFALHPYARVILDRLNSAGYEAVLIGGVVRDGVRSFLDTSLTFSPQDVDIATSALPDEIRRLFRGHPVVGVGEEFGVLVIVAPDGHEYEVATFRVEGEYDGRWPGKVELVRDLEEDLRRRDLTINGLAATVDGEVIDLVGESRGRDIDILWGEGKRRIEERPHAIAHDTTDEDRLVPGIVQSIENNPGVRVEREERASIDPVDHVHDKPDYTGQERWSARRSIYGDVFTNGLSRQVSEL
jgi:hypothetical protein